MTIAGSSSSENDLAHEWYSLNSEWTNHGTQPGRKPACLADFEGQIIASAHLCKGLSQSSMRIPILANGDNARRLCQPCGQIGRNRMKFAFFVGRHHCMRWAREQA